MFNYFKNQKLIKNASDELFILMNSYARNKDFYHENGVNDDPDGRFEMVAFFATAIFTGLSGRGEFELKISQALFDKIFKAFDQALRDFGISDLKVGDRIKIMAESFYGRQHAYVNAHREEDEAVFLSKIELNILGKEGVPSDISIKLAKAYNELVLIVKNMNF